MIRLGLDFDNTLITYDQLFYKVALKKKLIDEKVSKDKASIRDYLKKRNKEKLFTNLQGEIYGLKIIDALPAKGMIEALKKVLDKGAEIYIVSHKTKFPYEGPKYDLHEAAISWMRKNNFFNPLFLNLRRENVFFELTKENKINRIKSLNCTHFIDDLPEILDMIDDPNIKKIFYNPLKKTNSRDDFYELYDWEQLNTKL